MPATHCFGPYTLSLAQRSLSRGGQPLALGGRAFDLLVALVERSGRLVGKDELLDAVWGRAVVEEGNLHVQVSALRKLLGAEAITTIPGHGYRFNLAVLAATTGTGAATTAVPPTTTSATTPTARSPATAVAEPAAAGLAAAPTPGAPGGALLFGRDADLAALHGLLASHRLVTVVGPGGIGKTRLARAAMAVQVERYADGAVLVELAALNDAAMIPGAIAAALQLPLPGTKDPLQALVAALRPLRVLLLLDNAEHLVDAVADVVQALLQDDAPLQVLVTSQLPLKLAGEQVLRLGGLAVPEATAGVPELAQALRCGAVALFNDRVQAADRHFRLDETNIALAIDICRQLDGIALAIELAAARVPLLGLQGVSQRLDERLRLLRSGSRSAPSRQQTLQAAMDWSHALLTADQARVFRQLGVFSGGFTLALAAPLLQLPGLDEWAGIDLLADLVDRSLVAVDGSHLTKASASANANANANANAGAGAAPRYRLLETGRAYALDKLRAAGEIADARRRHAEAVRALFETAHTDCWQLPEAEFVARYEAELDNLRAAFDWALQADAPAAIALAGASSRLWRGLSLHPEALRRCAQAAALIDDTTPPPLAARLWEATAQLSGEIASPDSRAAAQHALTLYREVSDRRGEYLALAHLAFSYRAATPEAEAAFARMRALEDPAWPPALRLYGCKVEGGLASDAGRLVEAKAAQETRLALATAAGVERDVNAALGNLADLALMAGDAGGAVRLGRELLQRLGRRQMATRAIALGNLLLALLAQGALADARQVQAEFIGVVRQLDHMFVMYTADAMAGLAAAEGRWAAAAQLMGYADAAYATEGQPREPNEARARETAWALLQAQGDEQALAAGLAAGAALQPAAVCALALQG